MFLTVTIAEILFCYAPETRTLKSKSVTVDYSNASDGYFSVKHVVSERKLKLRVSCGNNTDTYDLAADGSYYYFPLQYGSGTYVINVYGNVEGTRYAQVFSSEFKANITDSMSCYLYPNQRVWYTADSECVRLADELCSGLETELDKIQALYKWVTANIKYDYILSMTVESGYLPDNDATLKNKTGICYDYSSLLCAMLRSQGIYAKLVTGTVNSTMYHAWNSVYVNGSWKMLDATTPGKYSASQYTQENTY